MGRELAIESPAEGADIVIPVPDSGVPAALGFSQQSGVPFEMGIIRNHYIGRTFIQPSQSIRNFGVKIKLNPQVHVLKGKSVVVIDDSIVRGTTSKKSSASSVPPVPKKSILELQRRQPQDHAFMASTRHRVHS